MFYTTQRLSWLSSLATIAVLGFMTLLSGCGGGGASATPNIALSVDPATATLYMGYPTTFTITGGRAPYSVSAGDPSIHFTGSSNNTLTVNGNTFVVNVDNVNADTSVTLTVRDADGKSATTSVTVKPASLDAASLVITGQTAAGGSQTFISSGLQGTASVTAKSATGAPLMGHKVRFHVTDQGAAYGFICNQTLGDCLVIDTDSSGRILTVETTTDQSGNAYAVIKADASATTQYATISATDQMTGFVLRKQFVISGPALAVLPGTATWTFVGNNNGTLTTPGDCPAPPNGAISNFYIYGGTPPYTITTTAPSIATLALSDTATAWANTITVAAAGSTFSVRAECNAIGTANIAVRDSAGSVLSTVTFTVVVTTP